MYNGIQPSLPQRNAGNIERCAMQYITVRALGLTGVVLLLCMPQSSIGGTIRHDREDLLYTDLAALPDFQSVGKLQSNDEIDVYSGTLIAPQWVLTAAH